VKKGTQIDLNVGASGKTYIVKFNKTGRPKRVSINGKDVPHVASREALEKTELGWYFDPTAVVYVKFSPASSATELVLRS
jgi:hypothetical protein